MVWLYPTKYLQKNQPSFPTAKITVGKLFSSKRFIFDPFIYILNRLGLHLLLLTLFMYVLLVIHITNYHPIFIYFFSFFFGLNLFDYVNLFVGLSTNLLNAEFCIRIIFRLGNTLFLRISRQWPRFTKKVQWLKQKMENV